MCLSKHYYANSKNSLCAEGLNPSDMANSPLFIFFEITHFWYFFDPNITPMKFSGYKWPNGLVRESSLNGLRIYIQGQKDLASSPNRCFDRLWDSSSLWSKYTVINVKYSDSHWVSEAALSEVAQSWLWGSQVADKKTGEKLLHHVYKTTKHTATKTNHPKPFTSCNHPKPSTTTWKIVGNSPFHPQIILNLEECLQKWWNTNLVWCL